MIASPFFTIIIVVFNGEKTLQRALDSVSIQTFSDFEILIIDGLSTDNTVKIIQKNAISDPRIKYVSEKDEGIYDAMNKGVKMAEGKWLYFLGSDDWLYDKCILDKVASTIESNQCEIIYGDVLLMPGQKKYGGEFSEKDLMLRNISHQAIFYRYDVFLKVGQYNTTYKTHADWDYNIRCFYTLTRTWKHIDLIVAYFVKGGASTNHDQQFLIEVLVPLFTSMVISNFDVLKDVELYDAYWRLLRNANARNIANMNKIIQRDDMPKVLSRIIRLQQKIPWNLLQRGFFSKFFMMISYLQNRILGFK